jgi:hypothetical protein
MTEPYKHGAYLKPGSPIRAELARRQRPGRLAVLLMGLTLEWEVLAPEYTGKLSAPCGVES